MSSCGNILIEADDDKEETMWKNQGLKRFFMDAF